MTKSEISEQQRVVLLMEGNEDAYKYFFHKHYERLVRYLDRILADTTMAEDLATEVFVKLWVKCRELDLRNAGHVENTLYLICKRDAYTYLRNSNRRTEKQDVWIALHTNEEDDFQDVMDNEELRARALELIYERARSLSPRCKEVFELRYGEGLSVSEIAGRLGMTEQNVLNHSAKAIDILRRNLKENGLLISLLLFF